MKKALFIFLLLTLLFGCTRSEDLPKKLCYSEEVNDELIQAIKELNIEYINNLTWLQGIYEDRSEPRLSSRVKPVYFKIDSSYNVLCSHFGFIHNSKKNLKLKEKSNLIKECQNFTIGLTEVVFRKELPYPSTIIDSNNYNIFYDTLITNHQGQSYDTVLFHKLSRNYYKACKIIDHCDDVKSSANELQLLLAHKFMLKSMYSVIMWRLSGCYAPYATSDIKVYTKRLNKETNDDSLTLQLNIGLVLDVQATEIFVEGVPGRGWVENENFYFKVRAINKDTLIKGRMGIKNKSGEVRCRDFESLLYH